MINTITTQRVNCKDCHRCVRSCPVKAIGIEQGHARLLSDKCILCGRCVVECPQNAKKVISQLDLVKQEMGSGRKVVLSLAPSFIGAFPEFEPQELVAALHALGFAAVEETAVGAEIVSQHYAEFLHETDSTVISACCPVIVNLITRYYPGLADNLAPVVSPMLAHGRLLRQTYGGDCFIVFAGPCIAKIDEGQRDEFIDAVVTFEELRGWLNKEINIPQSLPEAAFDRESWGTARYYPISGGILKTFVRQDGTDIDIITADGIEKCMEVFDAIDRGQIAPHFVEALACDGGCIGGPVAGKCTSVPARRFRVIEFARQGSTKHTYFGQAASLRFDKTHQPTPVYNAQPTEMQIREILQQTGKVTLEDEKNCGACGYNSCRDKAVAVYQGLAEIDMCVPYMRSKAESFANIIVDNSINAIIVVNESMVIQEFNSAAERMFNQRAEMVKGSNLSQIMNCREFMEAAASGTKVLDRRVEYPLYGLITEQVIIPVPEHGLLIAIITDVTVAEQRDKEWQKMRTETVEKAAEIIKRQMHVAQEIAGLMGETTAETKAALLEMVALLKNKGN